MQNTSTLGSAFASTWALLLGFGVLMLGDGLQGPLLAVRAIQEGFSTSIAGIIMSVYFFGFLIGSILTPKIVVSVGHIRAFAALAATASAAILVHAVFIHVYVWMFLRIISGFCLAGLYIVAESWLNDKATNETRGQILSLYMIVTYLGVGIGQLLLNISDPMGYPLFILTSVLISIAVIPLLLSAKSTPLVEHSSNLKLTELIRISPCGSIGLFIVGLVTAAFFSLGPIYASLIGLNVKYISYFMTAAVIGTVVFQWPIGFLSDRIDRRWVIAGATFLSATTAIICSLLENSSITLLLIAVGIFGGLSLPLYSLCVAYTNDRLEVDQMVAASGSMVLISGIGAVFGPVLITGIMNSLGINYFFRGLACALMLLAIFTLYRINKRKPIKISKQSTVVQTGYLPSSTVIESVQQYAKDEIKLGINEVE